MQVSIEFGGANRQAYLAPRSTVAQVLAAIGAPSDSRVIDEDNGEVLGIGTELLDGQQLRVKPKAQDGGVA